MSQNAIQVHQYECLSHKIISLKAHKQMYCHTLTQCS